MAVSDFAYVSGFAVDADFMVVVYRDNTSRTFPRRNTTVIKRSSSEYDRSKTYNLCLYEISISEIS